MIGSIRQVRDLSRFAGPLLDLELILLLPQRAGGTVGIPAQSHDRAERLMRGETSPWIERKHLVGIDATRGAVGGLARKPTRRLLFARGEFEGAQGNTADGPSVGTPPAERQGPR